MQQIESRKFPSLMAFYTLMRFKIHKTLYTGKHLTPIEHNYAALAILNCKTAEKSLKQVANVFKFSCTVIQHG